MRSACRRVSGTAFSGAAVHRVHELELADAVVVFGLRFAVDLVHRQHFLVAARLREVHRGRTIRQHVDVVVERARHHAAVRSLELDLVEAGFVDAQHRHEMAVGRRHELERVAAVHDRRVRPASAPST